MLTVKSTRYIQLLPVYPNARIFTTVYARETATLERPFSSVKAVFFHADKKPQWRGQIACENP